MNIKSTIIFLCLYVYGCSTKTGDVIDIRLLKPVSEYPVLEISTELLDIKDPIPLAPDNIWVEDTLIITKTRINNGFLRLYSLNSGELVKSYGSIGQGPGEYLYPQVFKNAKGEYIISDRLKFGVVHIDQMLSQENYKAEIYPVEKGLTATNFISMLSDNNQIIFNSGSDENQLCFMRLDDMKIEPYNRYPAVQGVKVNNFIANTNVFRSSMYRHGDFIFAAYTLYPIVDIISVHTKEVKRSMHPLLQSVNMITMIDHLNAVIDNRFMYNLASYATNEGFYTLYYGDSEENIENFNTTPEILKYDDYTGDLLVRYKLNNIVYNFCIDDSGENGYFLSLDKNFNTIFLKSPLKQ